MLYSLQDEYLALPAASRRRVRAKVMELLDSREAAVQRAAIIAGFRIMETEDREEMLSPLGEAAEAYNKRPLGPDPSDRVRIAKKDSKYTISIEVNAP